MSLLTYLSLTHVGNATRRQQSIALRPLSNRERMQAYRPHAPVQFGNADAVLRHQAIAYAKEAAPSTIPEDDHG